MSHELTKELETIVEALEQIMVSADYAAVSPSTGAIRSMRDTAYKALAQAPALLARVKEMEAVNRAIGVACLEHDLVHYIKCGHCYEKLEAELATLKAQQGPMDETAIQALIIEAIPIEMTDDINKYVAKEVYHALLPYLRTPQQQAKAQQGAVIEKLEAIKPYYVTEIDAGSRVKAEAISIVRQHLPIAPAQLWLWKNFVDDKLEYWAFDNPYPCHPHGDPMTLGEPCGYALVKPSTNGRPDLSRKAVIAAIKLASKAPAEGGDISALGALSKCPKCGGTADNGHDRCFPPSPYYCTKCTDAAPPAPTTEQSQGGDNG